MAIDPTHHEDGQKAAMQYTTDIGRPSAVLNSLAASVNSRVPPEPYHLEAGSISDPATFWKFVEENEGDITLVRFEMFAPNMFGVPDYLNQEMKELRDNENAQRVELALESDDGLRLKTERTRNTAEYTAESGGSIYAETRTKKRFHSRGSIRGTALGLSNCHSTR